MIELPNSLPIQDVIKDIQLQLHTQDELILEAPPGAGKTTLVPLALIDQTWLGDKKILMLEPRRIAARSAAHRLAELLGERPGQTVGYRMRLDSRVSNATKLEVITEGILTRMLQVDPSLEDVGLVIFDEFHERSLDSDLALALCLKGRELFRQDEPLKLLVMSATLESKKTADLLNAPVIVSEGKQFPVDIIQGKASQPRDQIVSRVVEVTMQALVDNPHSSLLVFLPGQGEIQRAFDELSVLFRRNQFNSILLKPLFGNLSIEEQTRAISPSEPGKTKVVLATNIAETSLTIDGVDVVIDSGLVRQPVFDPNTGMTRLSTVKISKASSIQRAGRAGRLRPGKCYRLWSRDQQERLAPYSSPEILSADLAPLVLQLRQWGVDDPAELSWLDPPPAGPWQQALELLTSLGAIRPEVSLTDHGASMATLPVHPRLAHLLIRGKQVNQVETACLLAALLSERDPFSRDDPDIDFRLEVLNGQTQCQRQFMGWKQRVNQLSSQFKTQLAKLNLGSMFELEHEQVTGYLLACAYPDRLARRRHSGGYQLSNGPPSL